MTHWARPGVKCEFLGHRKPTLGNVIRLEKGRVFTVRGVFVDPYSKEAGIRLEEVVNNIHPRGGEYGYPVSSFRPLVIRTQEQDMELFTPLLDVHNHKELKREFQ